MVFGFLKKHKTSRSRSPDSLGSAADFSSEDATLAHLISEIKDYQLAHGSVLKLVRFEEPTTVPARPIQVSVLPTLFPKTLFDEAIALQPHFNELYVRAASDERWLAEAFGPLLEQDALVAALWKIHLTVREAGDVQDVVCGIFRSDYMVHAPSSCEPTLKQVEINTFFAAGACHAERVAKMHRHLRVVCGRSMDAHIRRSNERGDGRPSLSERGTLPPNENTSAIVALLTKAHDFYKPRTAMATCSLMVVQPFNFNVADERPIEYGLWAKEVACFRCEWSSILDWTRLTSDRTLLFRPPLGTDEYEVSIIYYRAGHDTAEYDDRGVRTRIQLELSRSIKCPDVLTHLTNMKVVQAAIANHTGQGQTAPFEIPPAVAQTFMPMHRLDHDSESRELALNVQFAKDFVLKPNLDGGGHNIYGEKLPQFLSALPRSEWPKYTLMRMIEPPAQHGYLMTSESMYKGEVVSELGIVGTCMWRRRATDVAFLHNEAAGWTFKTKPAHVDEMSVVKGYGCFDCPLLVDEMS